MERPQRSKRSLLPVLDEASAWALALVRRFCDPSSRRGLSQLCKACQLLVVEAAEQMTITLLAYGGLSEAAWQRRLASVAQGLAARGEQRGAKLVLRQPTPNPAALQFILSIPEAAGRAVTELVVQQVQSHESEHDGVDTPWLSALPAAFPNLRVLRIGRLYGCLPDAALLPHLRELQVHICARVQSFNYHRLHEQCASIGALLVHVTTLHVTAGRNLPCVHLPWSRLFNITTHTLTHLETNGQVTGELLRALCARVPRLHHLRVGPVWDPSGPSKATWAVRELVVPAAYTTAEALASLPESPELHLLANKRGMVELHFYVQGVEGFRDQVTTRMQQWRYPAPCIIHLGVMPNLSPEESQAALKAALLKLDALSPGSVVQLDAGWHDSWQAGITAARAAGADLSHITIIGPCVLATDSSIGHECERADPPAHTAISCLYLAGGEHKHAPWPWQSIRVLDYEPTNVFSLLNLPNPCAAGREYDVYMGTTVLVVNTSNSTADMQTELVRRMQHLIFLMQESKLLIPSPEDADSQLEALKGALQVASGIRMRRAPVSSAEPLTVSLRDWYLPENMIRRLAQLPVVDFPARLTFENCVWHVRDTTGALLELANIVPACYKVWDVSFSYHQLENKIAILQAICLGAAGCDRELTLRVMYNPESLKDHERSQLEAYMDKHSHVAKYVTVEWYLR